MHIDLVQKHLRVVKPTRFHSVSCLQEPFGPEYGSKTLHTNQIVQILEIWKPDSDASLDGRELKRSHEIEMCCIYLLYFVYSWQETEKLSLAEALLSFSARQYKTRCIYCKKPMVITHRCPSSFIAQSFSGAPPPIHCWYLTTSLLPHTLSTGV